MHHVKVTCLLLPDVERVETSLVEKIGRDLLKERFTPSQRLQEAEVKKRRLLFERDIIPRPDASRYAERPSVKAGFLYVGEYTSSPSLPQSMVVCYIVRYKKN
jgi:hypothetical protein